MNHLYSQDSRRSWRVLVTGCAGFIGWKVSEHLLSAGHEVVGVDNLNHAYDVRLKAWRLRQLHSDPRFHFYRLDVADREAVRRLFTEASLHPASAVAFDAVVHLAARAEVRQSIADPWAYYETNVVGTLNLLELCREWRVHKFILASTSSLYGRYNPRPFRENMNTDRPLSPYAASKKAAEALCHAYHYLYGFDVIILRYFSVYGPAGRPDMSIFRFVRWIAEGEPVVVYGDGTQERGFTYVDDIARGTIAAVRLLTGDRGPGTGGRRPETGDQGRKSETSVPGLPSPVFEIINLGSDRPVSINKVITLLEELLGRQARRDSRPPHPADVPATWADISKARRLLGWKPQTDLAEGLQWMVAWYMQERAWARSIALFCDKEETDVGKR